MEIKKLKINKLSKLAIECITNNFVFRSNDKKYCTLGEERNSIDCPYFKKEEKGICEYE